MERDGDAFVALDSSGLLLWKGSKTVADSHLGVSGAQREMAGCCYSTQASTWYSVRDTL